MNKPFLTIIGVLCFSAFSFGQTIDSVLQRAKNVRLLQDERAAVRQILHDFVLKEFDESDDFTQGNITIEVTYSQGGCVDEDGDEYYKAIWDVEKGLATRIVITTDYDLSVTSAGLDLSKLYKEQMYPGDEERFIYHDKNKGFAVEVSEVLIEKIILFPPVKSESKTCKSEFAKEFVSEKSWFGKTKLEDRFAGCIMLPANVTNLELSETEIRAVSSKKLLVSVTAVDPENDVLTYVYIVSAGRIIGNGAEVTWDLTGVSAGTYTITAGVDDGCGLCGQTMTKTVTVN